MSTVPVEDIRTTESTLTTDDHVSLYTKTWHASSAPIARVVFLHGFSDHCNFYGVLFPSLAQHGIKVYGIDQRGWGRSVRKPSDRGDTGGSQRILEDLTCLLTEVLTHKDEEHVPLFLMGHSMGGGEILYYAAHGPPEIRSRIRGYLCEAPFIAFHPHSAPWRSTVFMGKLASKLVPRHQLLQKLDAAKICRDAAVYAEWEADPLSHDTATLECLAALLDRTAELEDGRAVIRDTAEEKRSLWVGIGTADQIVSYDACQKWFARLEIEDKEFHAYEGWSVHTTKAFEKPTPYLFSTTF